MNKQTDRKEEGKLLIMKDGDSIFTFLIRERRIITARICSNKRGSIGDIYVGRVKNVSENIGAAFVEIQKGELTFLPLKEARNAILTTRKADGRLKIGDELLLQLVKEPQKTKLPGTSTHLSLAGIYAVIEYPGGEHTQKNTIHVSAKLGTRKQHMFKEEEALRRIAEKYRVTIRTNAGSIDDVSLVIEEAERLAAQMDHILEIGDKRTCFSRLYQNEAEYLTFIKNTHRSEYEEIVTDKKEIYEALLHTQEIRELPLRLYEDEAYPLYKLYSLETRVKELLDKKVWLKSGGYLVIEQTEALIAIDVNTGKCEAGKNQEETYLKINLEAAEAIAWSLRARNLSGMILVDFINMKKKEHEEQLLLTMRNYLKEDPVMSSVVDITGLGLVEITRKKQNRPFAEQLAEYRKGKL